MVLCREWTKVKHQRGIAVAEPLKCRCWSCDYCYPIRLRQLKGLARAGLPDTFLTLTVNPAYGLTPDERARGLAKAWRLIRKRAMRRYGYKAIPFLAVFEKTKRGEPHLHILMRVKWLDQRWVSKVMEALIGAPIVDIRRIQSVRKAAAYIAKYVGKDPSAFEGCKRYWRSQDWEPKVAKDNDGESEDTVTIELWKGSVDSYLTWECLFGAGFMWDGGQKVIVYLPSTGPPRTATNKYQQARL